MSPTAEASNSTVLYFAGRFRLGTAPHAPQPPNCQRPTAAKSTAENATLKNEHAMTKKLLATQEMKMKRLTTVIDDLQTQLEKVRMENRTLKQVGPPFIALHLKYIAVI